VAWKIPVSISQECLERGKLLQQQQQLSGRPLRRRTLSPTRAALFAQEEAENRVERPSKRVKPANEEEVNNVNIESNDPAVRVLLSLVRDKQESRVSVDNVQKNSTKKGIKNRFTMKKHLHEV
jgi:hypothetical protein